MTSFPPRPLSPLARYAYADLDLTRAMQQMTSTAAPAVSKFSAPVKYARLGCNLEDNDDIRIAKATFGKSVVFTSNEDKRNESTVVSSTADARKFARAILDMCDEADKA